MKTGSEFHVGIVGLGSMGMGAALSCVRAGLSTWGADLNSNACATLKEAGACGVSDNAATFAEKLDALLVLVVVKAANGEMTVMASGSDIAFERLAPVLEAVAGKVYRIGAEPGLGSTVKIIHQLLAGVHIAAGAEAMALAARAGIPLDVMYDVVTNAAGNSWMFENRMRHVVDGDYTPHSAVDIFVKDLGLVADTAKALHFPLPLASTALNMFTSASNAGYGKEDDSAVIKIFSGITLPGAKS
ncbi:MAG: NAD(P)-dependent oxidoreductase [Escherichia coli]|nr:NAD(P)-dependent oxidoreductase [Escherichia coli]